MKLVLLAALIGLAFGKVDYSGHQVYRVHPDETQLRTIKETGDRLELDFWSEARFVGDNVDFRVPPNLKTEIDAILARNRISFEIFIEDVQFAIDRQSSPARPAQMSLSTFEYDVYHNYTEIDNWITSFAFEHGNLVKAVDVGTGKSLEGKNLRALKISTGDGRDAFVINCGIHACEWIGPAVCLYAANRLVTSYGHDDKITALMNSVDFYITPTSNPDGYNYTLTDRMWRKTRSTAKENNCTTKTCYGVDPNRNFDVHWDGMGSSANCCSDMYRGPRAFSEIETLNQKNFVNALKAKGFIDVHSYSQLWMYPYSWTTQLPPHNALLNEVGEASVAAIKNVHGKVYKTGTIANTIYVASGSTADYFFDQGVVCSFGAELRDTGKYGFLLPEDQIIPTGEEVFEGLMTIATYIADGKC